MKLHISSPDGEPGSSKVSLVPATGKPIALPAAGVSFRLAAGEIAVASVEFHSPTIEAKADANLVDIIAAILEAVSDEKAMSIIQSVNARVWGVGYATQTSKLDPTRPVVQGIMMEKWGSDSPPPAGAPFWRDVEPGEGVPNRPPDGHVPHGGTAAEFSQGNPLVAVREWAKENHYSLDDHEFRRAARLVEGRLVEFASAADLDIAAVCRKLVVFGVSVVVDQPGRAIRILFSMVDAPPLGDTPDVNPVAAVRHYCEATGTGYTIDSESFDEAERDVGKEMKRRNIRGIAPITSKLELDAVGRMLSEEFGYTAFRDAATATFRLIKNPSE